MGSPTLEPPCQNPNDEWFNPLNAGLVDQSMAHIANKHAIYIKEKPGNIITVPVASWLFYICTIYSVARHVKTWFSVVYVTLIGRFINPIWHQWRYRHWFGAITICVQMECK